MNMDDNEFKNKHKEIIRGKGEGDIRIYWIDDCFINPKDEKGILYLDQLGYFDHGNNEFKEGIADKKFENAGTDNGNIYINLRDSCIDRNIGFHVCSFEYAEEQWIEIDRINHLILMDIGYTGKPDQNYGITLYNKMTKENPKKARFCFLSGYPERVNRVFTEIGEEHQPITFAKASGSSGTVALFDTPQNSKDTYFDIQVNTLIDKQPQDLSLLDVAQWLSLRREMCNAAISYGKINEVEAPYYKWVHHLKGGGKGDSKKIDYSEGFELLKKACNHPVSSFPLNLPDYFWEITDKSWKYPPVRALGQFNRYGLDLTRFFYHLGKYCNKKFGSKIHLHFTYPAVAMEHDYLWFNCAALGEGLITFAEGFFHDFDEGQEPGDLFWSVNEILNGECGLEIIIRQYVHLKFEEYLNAEKQNFRGDTSKREPNCRIPTKDASKGNLSIAYNFFEKAGAQDKMIGTSKYKYDLRLFIPAEKSPNGLFWQVKTKKELAL